MLAWLRKKVARPAAPPPSDTPAPAARSPEPLPHELVARRAAEIWHRKGRPFGQDAQNWLEAEAELRAERQSADPRKSR